jgi:hypothetical protein
MKDDTNDTQKDGDVLSSDMPRSSFFDDVAMAPPKVNLAKLSGVARAAEYMRRDTAKRLPNLRAGEDDDWYGQTEDGRWRGGVRYRSAEVFAFFAPAKEELIERYETWVLPGLRAGEFDELIEKHLESRKKT